MARQPGQALTPIEIDILLAAGAGETMKETAVRIGRAYETVQTHRKHILEKLEAHSIAHAFAIAYRRGLIA